ncbi:MAG: class I SAM-dependent methyltransferase [Chthoniobacterales bacterium]
MAEAEDKARAIIDRAMSDPAVYQEMARREGEVWGNILPARDRSEAVEKDHAASQNLLLGRHQSSLAQVAKERGFQFEKGVSLGCGAGRLERSLLAQGVCQSLHGIDVSEGAVAEARAIAERESLPLTYEVADLNFVQLPPKTYDLVIAQTSLHHVLFLERVAAQAWQALRENGLLWIHDFIGETQGQYDPKRLALINELLAILPEKFRTNTIQKRIVTQARRPVPGFLGSPFEKIRSEEIIKVFEQWFSIEWKGEFTGFLDLVAPPGTRGAYVENKDTRALFEVLLLFDNLCVREGIIKPVGGQYLMKPRQSPLTD